jgi:hypothetical protein
MSNSPQVQETVTSLTAKSLDPKEAVERIFADEGLLLSYWRAVDNILQVVGLKEAKAHIDTLDNVDFDKVAAMGNFGSRPSDLFLRVHPCRHC